MPKISENASVEAIIQPGMPLLPSSCWLGVAEAKLAEIWRALMPRIRVSMRARIPRTRGQRRILPLYIGLRRSCRSSMLPSSRRTARLK